MNSIMRISVIPEVIYRGITTNYGLTNAQGEKGVKRLKSVRLLPETPITITIADNPIRKKYDKIKNASNFELAQMIGGASSGGNIYVANQIINPEIVRQQLLTKETATFKPVSGRGSSSGVLERGFITREIKKKLRELVKDAVRVGLDNDIAILLDDEEGSPPEVLGGPETQAQFEEDEDEWIKENVSATFSVIKDGPYLNRLQFAQERVFLSAAPTNRFRGSNKFYQHQNNLGLTCAYEYLINTYANVGGFKKLAKNKKAIDKAIALPTEEHELIFKNWKQLYSEEYYHTDKCQDVLPEYVITEELKDPYYTIRELKFEKTWSKKQEDESLSVEDLVKWCIAAKMRLNVVDHTDNFYLSYIPDEFKKFYKHNKNNKTSKANISVVVKNNHAYFITDPKIKSSLSLIDRVVNYDHAAINNKVGEDKTDDEDIKTHYIGYGLGQSIAPPPTPKELMEYSEGKDRYHYYVDKSKLNGLANLMYKNHNIKPTAITGTIASIHRLTYGKNLRIYSNKTDPPNPEYLTPYEGQGTNTYDRFYESYPEAKKAYGMLPKATDVAQAIYDKEIGVDVMSMFNSQMRQIFFDNEIKPDFRVMKPIDDSSTFSVDIHRAYSTAMKEGEYEYSIFDAVNQPATYRGEFNPNYFYLCYNRDNEFPLRGGLKKLLMYHGCLIQHLLDRVDIKYVLKPSKTLPKDHFKPFVENCHSWSDEYGFEKEKKLVNVFIGNLKKKDGISDYKLWLVDDKITTARELRNNRYVSKLCDGSGWGRECCIVGYPKHQEHFKTANPIRLQILEMINETNFKIYNHYKSCLHSCKFITDRRDKLVGVKTDALYFGNPCGDDYPYEWMNYLIDGWNDGPFGCAGWTIRKEHYLTNEYGEQIEDCLKPNTRQIGVEYVPNRWEVNIDIKHKWVKETEGRLYLKLLLNSGGGWVSGLGGRGKSELINEFHKMIDRNKKIFRKLRGIYQYCFPEDYHERLELWKSNNPTYVKWLAPTNKACLKIGGQTIHKGLGIPVIKDDDDEDKDEVEDNDRVKSGEVADTIVSTLAGRTRKSNDRFIKRFRCDVIVIDELSMVGSEHLSYFAYIKRKIPTIKFLLMGDLKHQLKPVKEENRSFETSFVIKELSNFNKMTLHYNFRTGKGGKDELFELCKTPEKLIKTGEPTRRNLCFSHATRKRVIDECQERLIDPIVVETTETKKGHNETFKYQVGVPVVSRKTNKTMDIVKNEYYTITEIGDLITLKYDDKEIKVSQEDLIKYFLSGFCITIHSSQSETYRDEYTIHEWHSLSYQSNSKLRLRYTAFSRSSDWENLVRTA